MATSVLAPGKPIAHVRGTHGLDQPVPRAARIAFAVALVGGPVYAGISIVADTAQVGETLALGMFLFLALALSAATANLRADMYLVLDTTKLVVKDGAAPAGFTIPQTQAIVGYQGLLEQGTRYIPNWVKITVAIALGLGTMVGWKRIVKTVGEKIGSAEFTYAMGTSAQLVAAATILLAQFKGLPVSTTHVLSSGVAGAAVGNGQSLNRKTIGTMLLAWVLTLPAAMLLAGGLYWLMLQGVRAAGL